VSYVTGACFECVKEEYAIADGYLFKEYLDLMIVVRLENFIWIYIKTVDNF